MAKAKKFPSESAYIETELENDLQDRLSRVEGHVRVTLSPASTPTTQEPRLAGSSDASQASHSSVVKTTQRFSSATR